ncbi:unnamed protein product [Chrysodeixis includens]|uniref:Uncharacterized protein n=1 Tax=Chrysodeixis includens TaxID=689277 RepID=A0A9P0C4Z3_CHRIL|nr:unnamed protein product [Chrysodeixis includens]
MKFLVLALCVCAASAASFGAYKPFSGFNRASAAVYQPAQQAAAFVYQPAQQVATAVVAAPKVAAEVVYQPAVAVAKAVPYAAKESEAAILRADSEVGAEGYNYAYETANRITGQASGALKKVGEDVFLVSQGTYSYVDPQGKTVTVNYVADENGYQPQSDVLPVGPAIPEAIARSLAYIAAKSANTVQKF